VPGCVIGKLGLSKKGSWVLLDRLERQTDELIEQHWNDVVTVAMALLQARLLN
jgi:hypothetical protein